MENNRNLENKILKTTKTLVRTVKGLPRYLWLVRSIEILSLHRKIVVEIIDLLKSVFSHFGIPLSVVSDKNPSNSDEFIQFAADWGFSPSFTAPRYSQANGQAEKGVSIAKTLLQKNTDLQVALLQYTNAPIPSLKYSPSQLLLGRILQTKIATNINLLQPAVLDSHFPTFLSNSQVSSSFC